LEALVASQRAIIKQQQSQITRLEAHLAEKDAILEEQRLQVAALRKEVAELRDKLGQNSANSHRPPSSDPPGTPKRKRRKSKSGRTRGGQPGHRGTHRALVAVEQVDEFKDLFPSHCENCWEPLCEVLDPDAKRTQFVDLPPIVPHVTEVRRHRVRCPHCHYATRAPYDPQQIPSSPFGPRLMALMGVLTGVYQLSRRKTVRLLSEVLGIRVSLGALSAVEHRVSEALRGPTHQAWVHVQEAEVKHTDGTSWKQRGVLCSLWTIATASATVFQIVADSSKATLRPLFGALRGILVSDRAKALNFWAMPKRQLCWAHLLRKFVSFSERDGPAAALGQDLLNATALLFEYYHDYQDGKLKRCRLIENEGDEIGNLGYGQA
jgi:transposase